MDDAEPDALLSERKQVERVGDRVRRPVRPESPSVQALLRHLEGHGLEVPRVLDGGAASGTEVLSWVPGRVDALTLWSDDAMFALGERVADLHRAAADFAPPPRARWAATRLASTGPDAVIGHRDLAPWNIVTREVGGQARPVAFIDWERAGPIDQLTELAFVGWLNCRLFDDEICAGEGHPPATTRLRQLRPLLDGYGLDRARRARFASALVDVAVLTCADDVDEAGIDEHGVREDWLVWGVAWRARSAAWLVAHRADVLRAVDARGQDTLR